MRKADQALNTSFVTERNRVCLAAEERSSPAEFDERSRLRGTDEFDKRSRPREKNGQAERTVPRKVPGIRRKTQDELYDKGAGNVGGELFPDCSTQSPEMDFKKRERIIQCQMKPISQTRKKKSGWYTVILKIPLTPDLSEEAEKIGAQERTEGKVRMRGTKGFSDEVA